MSFILELRIIPIRNCHVYFVPANTLQTLKIYFFIKNRNIYLILRLDKQIQLAKNQLT